MRGGNLWTARQVIATLWNWVYLGLFCEKHDLRIGHHDPIVTHDLFAAAAAQLEARRTREPGKQFTIDWPLKGRIVCAVCERPMSPTRSGIGISSIATTGADLQRVGGNRAVIKFRLRRLRIPSRRTSRRSSGSDHRFGI